jgi:DNA-binding CsgD family transcriptional regulator|tara:strand:- start:408 stop:923 length:516 start_codon:yes stop_codon:yes gene_type:complete
MFNKETVMPIDARVASLEMKVKLMESRMATDMATILEMLGSGFQSAEIEAENNKAEDGRRQAEFRIILSKMTPKQHVAMQMVMAVCENSEIAEVVGVEENSAKMYVRNISAKMGLRFRADVREETKKLMEYISDDEYLKMSKGIPKHWWRDRLPDKEDIYAPIYKKPRKSV